MYMFIIFLLLSVIILCIIIFYLRAKSKQMIKYFVEPPDKDFTSSFGRVRTNKNYYCTYLSYSFSNGAYIGRYTYVDDIGQDVEIELEQDNDYFRDNIIIHFEKDYDKKEYKVSLGSYNKRMNF